MSDLGHDDNFFVVMDDNDHPPIAHTHPRNTRLPAEWHKSTTIEPDSTLNQAVEMVVHSLSVSTG